MAISTSLHRNVLLLSKIVLPSDEFKKHFREGMFDKPNTAGFLHTSHYLLSVYDSERFQKLVQWPVPCKKTEAKYRNIVKDYLTTISAENPDIGFPVILTSHLIHAGGNKFTIIMWKLSEVVVRKYIALEATYNVMFAPQMRTKRSLMKKFLQETNAKISSSILERHKELLEMEKTVKSVSENEKEELTNIRTEIFERERLITTVSNEAPVHASIRKCLLNVDDAHVIQMWKKNISKEMSHVKNKNGVLRRIEELSHKVNKIIMDNSSDINVLDAKQFQKVNYSEVSESFSCDMQCLLFQLYKNDRLILHNFILLFNSLLSKLHQRLKLYTLEEFSECLLQIEASCNDTKSALDIFQTYLSNIRTMMLEVQSSCQKNIAQTYDDALPVMNDIVLISSPLIKIDFNSNDDESELLKRLQLTPVEATYKSLFSRYERSKQNHASHGSNLRGNFMVSRINFDDTISSVNSEKQSLDTRTMSCRKNLSACKQAEKYSRLFSSRITRNDRAANSSIMSMPCSSNANSTAIASAIEEMHDTSEVSLNITNKSICNNSIDIVTPVKLTAKQESKSSDTSEMDDVVNALPCKPNVLDICETIEVEFTNNCAARTNEIGKLKPKRRSIGDLVERYKKLLELAVVYPSPNVSCVKYDNE